MAAITAGGHNGGPLWEEQEEALDDLRKLYDTLGQILEAIDNGRFKDDLGDGLVADAVRYGRRLSASLASDPMPYAVATLLMAVLTACGFPGAGAFLADVTLRLDRR